MEATVNVKCPYCGSVQRHLLHIHELPDSASRPEVVLCEPRFGGCDKWFVASVVTRYEVTTATISSEVEQAQPEAPAIVGPDWTTAPAWAQWWAVDSDGKAYWFDTEPRVNVACWDTPSFKCQMRLDRVVDLDGGHWYRSLVQRPQEAR